MISRRGLFELFTKREAPKAFSLGDFYERRGEPTPPPRFEVKNDLPVQTTQVGVTREAKGVVRIVESACLGYTSFCSVCAERCPVEGAIVIELGRPRVVESACDGCGECARVCPAPLPALRFVGRDT